MSLFKRIIFCLYFQNGYFHISRNFRLQKVGDVDWLIKNFGFGQTSNYIDEIIVTLVKKNPSNEDFKNFFENVLKLRKSLFIPMTLGGGIRDLKKAKIFFENGADKILLNTMTYNNKKIVNKIADFFGSQAISVMVDYKKKMNRYELYSNCGTKKEDIDFKKHLINLNNISCGDIILNSIDNDGNGEGLNLKILGQITDKIRKPILMMGGAGKPSHFLDALKLNQVSGVITANLFNFLGTGLKMVRKDGLDKKIQLAEF